MSKVTEFIVHESVTGESPIPSPTGFLREVFVIAPVLNDNTKYQVINSISEVETYTNDVTVKRFFEAGMNRVHLIGYLSTDTVDLTDVDMTTAFTIVVSPNVEIDDVTTVLDAFHGKVFVSVGGVSDTDYTAKGYCVGLDANLSGWMNFMVGRLLSQTTWSNFQLTSLPQFSDTPRGELSVWESDRASNLSFLIKDEYFNTMLGYWVFGDGSPIADAYIEREMRLNIQTSLINYLRAYTPPYTDLHLRGAKNVIQNVLDYYIDNGLLDSYDGLRVPKKSEQLPTDIIEHLVNNITFKFSPLGVIWKFNIIARKEV